MAAFLLTWKESGWPYADLLALVRAFDRDGAAEKPWRLRSHKQAQVGDRVWLLKQGQTPRGIFGVGRIIGAPTSETTEDGGERWSAMVRFEELVDPKKSFLIPEAALTDVLKPSQLRAQASGDPLSDEQDQALDNLLNEHPLDAAALRRMLAVFRAACPDFESFERPGSIYETTERQYKDDLARRLQKDVASHQADPIAAADSFIKLLTTKLITGKAQNLINQRYIVSRLSTLEPEARATFGKALGPLLAASDKGSQALGDFVTVVTPLLREARISGPENAARQMGALVLMLIAPREQLFIRRSELDATYARLTGRAFPRNLTHAEQQDEVNAFGQNLTAALTKVGLAPRDMIDVQSFLWIARDAFQNQGDGSAVTHALNTILYGPPGTGKTYATAKYAVEICDGGADEDRSALMQRYRELVEAGRIAFVTFHQSFAYEDFVEGLRPETPDMPEPAGNGEVITGAGQNLGFRLEVRDGVLKDMAKRAVAARGRSVAPADLDDIASKRVFKMSLGRANDPDDAHKYQDCIDGNFIALGYGGAIDWSAPEFDSYDAIRRRWQQEHPGATGTDVNIKTIATLRTVMRPNDLVVISEGNRRFRAIGQISGDYYFRPNEDGEYRHRRPVKWLWRSDEGLPAESIYRLGFVQLSVYQMRGDTINWPALKELIQPDAAEGTDAPPHVLIIDEINRANVSKTFGELITLLEDDKRAERENALSVRLPYSGSDFTLPANLYVLGTMNTADRSIALLDAALRRRFEFREVAPEPELLPTDLDGVDVRRVLAGINERLEYLFDRDHLIGHAFFIGAGDLAALSSVMTRRVIPLIAEYFHEDWEKVRAILNEASDTGVFVGRTELKPPRVFAEAAYESEQRWRYAVMEGPYDAAAFEQLYP